VVAANAHATSALFNLGVLYADFLKKPADGAPFFKRFLADAPSDDPLRAEAEKYVSAAAAGGPTPTPGAGAATTPAPSSTAPSGAPAVSAPPGKK
jgi:hypothetical protein